MLGQHRSDGTTGDEIALASQNERVIHEGEPRLKPMFYDNQSGTRRGDGIAHSASHGIR